MTRPVAILRPQPGNDASCALARSLGLQPVSVPLFVVGPLPWTAPDPAAHDALILTSANAVRWAGDGLRMVAGLPVFAVGRATAAAATAAGLTVHMTGSGDADALIERAAVAGIERALHLGGRESTVTIGTVVRRSIPVYASDPRPLGPADLATLVGSIAALHSPRAARQLGSLIDAAGIARPQLAIAALSETIAAAAGGGWGSVIVAPAPNDRALFGTIASFIGGTD